MSETLDDSSFEVIGSTVTFTRDNLPRRLRPIYRRANNDDVWFVAVTQDRDESTTLARLDPSEARDLAEEGHALIFNEPLRAKPGHVLLQLTLEGRPEYLSREEIPRRLREAESESLRQAATAFEKKNRDEVLRLLWYARRASLDDPLPLLLLLKLLERANETIEDLKALESELYQFDPASIEGARSRWQTAASLTPFRALLARPDYFPASSPAMSLSSGARFARASSRRP